MNLHVTNDSHGLYPVEIAKRIKNSSNSHNNLIVNLFKTSIYKDETITYISETGIDFKKYVSKLSHLDKIIFHPYNITGYRFLKIVLKKFPDVKVYWMCWSYELYNLPRLLYKLYDPFSADYVKRKKNLLTTIKNITISLFIFSGIKESYQNSLRYSHLLVHYFCSPFYSDFVFLQSITPNKNIRYLPIAYLSLSEIMPDLEKYKSSGNKIMIGHSSLPEGNHFEIIQKVSSIRADYPVFLPLAYGDAAYGNIIKNEAQRRFIDPDVLEEKLDRNLYYKKLTEVGWAIINTKVQQGIGNIIALVWMGVKIFLDNNTSTYKDLSAWGIYIFSVQDDLNEHELSNKLSFEQVENNKKKILEKFSEERINNSWKEFLY